MANPDQFLSQEQDKEKGRKKVTGMIEYCGIIFHIHEPSGITYSKIHKKPNRQSHAPWVIKKFPHSKIPLTF